MIDKPMSIGEYRLQPDGRYKGPDGHYYFRGQRDGDGYRWIRADTLADDVPLDKELRFLERRW